VGRTAIVTVAGRGIGRAIAEDHAREAARVVIASRSADGCASAVEAIEAADGTAIAKPTTVGINPEALAVAVAAIPMGRPGDPHLDVAPAVLYLATDVARYITGQTLGVGGAMFLRA
jgi:meso-butanediol dehydrogenase/(S,S)-butanediol dehydrogenase/diacetyl reductase